MLKSIEMHINSDIIHPEEVNRLVFALVALNESKRKNWEFVIVRAKYK